MQVAVPFVQSEIRAAVTSRVISGNANALRWYVLKMVLSEPSNCIGTRLTA